MFEFLTKCKFLWPFFPDHAEEMLNGKQKDLRNFTHIKDVKLDNNSMDPYWVDYNTIRRRIQLANANGYKSLYCRLSIASDERLTHDGYKIKVLKDTNEWAPNMENPEYPLNHLIEWKLVLPSREFKRNYKPIDPLQVQKDRFVDELIIDLSNNPETWSSIHYGAMNECIYKGDMIVYKNGTIFQPIHITLSKEQENRITPLIKVVYDNDYKKFFTKHFKNA